MVAVRIVVLALAVVLIVLVPMLIHNTHITPTQRLRQHARARQQRRDGIQTLRAYCQHAWRRQHACTAARHRAALRASAGVVEGWGRVVLLQNRSRACLSFPVQPAPSPVMIAPFLARGFDIQRARGEEEHGEIGLALGVFG